MARPPIPCIDWRGILRALDPYLVGEGGVIHIHTKSESPSSAFIKSLRFKMENGPWEKKWVTTQIDSKNPATHYLHDMLSQIEFSLQIPPLPTGLDNVPSHTINIATNSEAGHDINVRDVIIDLDYLQYRQNENNRARAKRIIDFLDRELNLIRFGIIFFESDKIDQTELNALRTILWDSGLRRLTEKGFLIIDISAEDSYHTFWPPDPNLEILLPETYDPEASKDAIEDLKIFLVEEGFCDSHDEAHPIALGLISGCNKPRDLYAKFGATMVRLKDLI